MRRPPVSSKFPRKAAGDAQGGRSPSCGGSRQHRCVPAFLAGAQRASGVGGTRPPRLSPGGGNGKGGDPNSSLPQAACFTHCNPSYSRFDLTEGAARPSRFPPFADSPCFHSHSSGALCSGASWCPQSQIGCCHLGIELSRPRFQRPPFRRDLAVTRTRRWVTNLHYFRLA
jgi:hypothetical protein